jgi:hypothetical protein
LVRVHSGIIVIFELCRQSFFCVTRLRKKEQTSGYS